MLTLQTIQSFATVSDISKFANLTNIARQCYHLTLSKQSRKISHNPYLFLIAWCTAWHCRETLPAVQRGHTFCTKTRFSVNFLIELILFSTLSKPHEQICLCMDQCQTKHLHFTCLTSRNAKAWSGPWAVQRKKSGTSLENLFPNSLKLHSTSFNGRT